MNLPEKFTTTGTEIHWEGTVEGEQIKVLYDKEISDISPIGLFAVFSNMGFHGWVESGYNQTELLWIATSTPIDYQYAADEIKNNEQITNE